MSGCESRIALNLVSLHEELTKQDTTIAHLLNQANTKLLTKAEQHAVKLQDSLKGMVSASSSSREEVRKGMRDASQRMATDIRGLEASVKQLSASTAKHLAATQESCSYQEGKLKGIKQVQESHASSMTRLQQLLEPVQGRLDALDQQNRDILRGIRDAGRPQQAQPPAAPQAEVARISQPVAQPGDLLEVAAGLAQGADSRREPASVQQPGREQMQAQQIMLGEEQMQAQDQEMVALEDESGAQPAATLRELQDLPRAATLIVRSLDAVLEQLEALKVSFSQWPDFLSVLPSSAIWPLLIALSLPATPMIDLQIYFIPLI